MHTNLLEILALSQAERTPRFDIYAFIHKGIRLMLTDLLVAAGRVDVDDPDALARFIAQVEHTADFCDTHLRHEDDFVHPAIDRAEPGAAGRIAAEHLDHARDIDALRTHARALAQCPPAQRRSACHVLYHAVSLFTAHNLAHMHIEETAHNAVLWAHYDDAQIMAVHDELLAHLSPAEKMTSMRWMIPALSPAERVLLLAELRAQAPAPAFDAAMAQARQTLDPLAWSRLTADLGLPAA